jgi:hypothetical protein
VAQTEMTKALFANVLANFLQDKTIAISETKPARVQKESSLSALLLLLSSLTCSRQTKRDRFYLF